ncbi:MAG: hypothetical protein ABIQ35_11150 [Verrucomicrobiota bacterium]
MLATKRSVQLLLPLVLHAQRERGLFQVINVWLVKEINLVRFGFADERGSLKL